MALDTFAHLDLVNDMFDRTGFYSDDEGCLGDEDFDDDAGFEPSQSGFMSIAERREESSAFSSSTRDVLRCESSSSPVDLADFATRILSSSVKRERDPSPIQPNRIGMRLATMPAALPIDAIDIDAHCRAPVSLDMFHMPQQHAHSAGPSRSHTGSCVGIPTTTTDIFKAAKKHKDTPKKQKDTKGWDDNSDALSCASSSSAISTGTNASFATTVSSGSLYGSMNLMPTFMLPALNVQEGMWKCSNCQLLHPADYKGCGKCCGKREDVEQPPPHPVHADHTNMALQQQGVAAMAAMGWYSNTFAMACVQQSLYSPHALSMSQFYQTSAKRPSMSSSQNMTRRGENVKDNPQMQKTAREGQKHWHDKVQQMRAVSEEAQTPMARAEFAEQRYYCTARKLKSQKESLLIFLQTATQQNLIYPSTFVHPADDMSGFVGWTGFRILPGCGDQFRAGVDNLFPETPKLNTLYHLFRRAGLVPDDWKRAWDGEVSFMWNPHRVS